MSTRCRLFVGWMFFALCGAAQSRAADTISQAFALDGIKKVVVRAHRVDAAKIRRVWSGSTLTILGTPDGGAKGYHPADPNWKETPARKWGLKFAAKRYGNVLVISSVNEIRYIHHYYYIRDLRISLPSHITLVKQMRKLNGEGKPDLQKS